jgi:chemotaxis signal transduction protein
VSEPRTLLHVLAAGHHLLLATQDLREVVAASPITPLPGPSKGIQGVVIHQGEFLPVLAWEDLPGGGGIPAPHPVLAVLRPRLAIPVERMLGMVDTVPEGWGEPESDAHLWASAEGDLGDLRAVLLDPERLVALLRRFRAEP